LLDVAAGSGALSIPAAELGAEVLATDLSPGMLDLLRARAQEAGVTGIGTAVMDGTDLDLEDQSFDRVCSQFGVMLFPDPDAGLREMSRVTAIGGLGVVVIFGRPERVVPIWLFGQALRTALPDVDLPPGNRLQTDPMSLADAMGTAGFTDVRLEKLDERVEVGSPQGAWDVMSSSAPGLAMFLGRLPDERVAAVRDTFVDSVLERFGPNVTELPVEIIVGIGSRW
jgi:SAM-dependent methyltransferase